MTLEAKLRAAAAAYAPLTALIGSPPRWWDTQRQQGSAFPSVTVLLVSGNKTYVFTGRLPTGWSRVQFTIEADSGEAARGVEAALAAMLDQANFVGVPGLAQYPSRIVLIRGGLNTEMQPGTPGRWWRTVDAMIFSNDNL